MMKQDYPATSRNRAPIAGVLRAWLPTTGDVLEVASGTGQHVAYFAEQFPGLQFQPSDIDADLRQSIAAWTREARVGNVLPPIELDAASPLWPLARADAIININMIHIAPWSCCQGLMAGAGRLLAAGSILYMYGPYRVADRPTAPSNEQFDDSLRRRDSRWGLRFVHDVAAEGEKHGLMLQETVDMPANNLSLIFRKE